MLSPVVGEDIYDVVQSIADLGETDKSQAQLQAVGKTWDRKGSWKAQSLYKQL